MRTRIEEVLVPVEQRHIDNGHTFEPTECPIALAAREIGLRTATMHCDGDGTLQLTAIKGYARRYLCNEADAWATRFDLRKPVTPTTFRFVAAESR